MYNYGYRDYEPQTARFTTIDPIKDGTNWFAYVNNDPVNFTDLWGVCASEKQNLAKPDYQPNIDLLLEGLTNLGGAILQGSAGISLASVPTGATQVIGALILVDAIADGSLAIGQIIEGAMGIEDGKVPSYLFGAIVTQLSGNESNGEFVEFITDGIAEKYGE